MSVWVYYYINEVIFSERLNVLSYLKCHILLYLYIIAASVGDEAECSISSTVLQCFGFFAFFCHL